MVEPGTARGPNCDGRQTPQTGLQLTRIGTTKQPLDGNLSRFARQSSTPARGRFARMLRIGISHSIEEMSHSILQKSKGSAPWCGKAHRSAL